MKKYFIPFAAALLLLSMIPAANAGNTVNIVACGYPSESADVFLDFWRSTWATHNAATRMFHPTHAALLFAHGEAPTDPECLYYNPASHAGEPQALNRENLEAILEWASYQGTPNIIRPGGGGGLIEEGERRSGRGGQVNKPYEPFTPPTLPDLRLPRDRTTLGEYDATDALNFYMLGYTGDDEFGDFWYLDYPAREEIYVSELAYLLWQAAGNGQLRVYAFVAWARPLYEALEAQRNGRPLFCDWSTLVGQYYYLTDEQDQNCEPKAENICNIPHSYHDRAACYWETSYARLPGDWDTWIGASIDGIFGPMDGKVYLSEATAYSASINSYTENCYTDQHDWMTPGYVLADADDIFLYYAYPRAGYTAVTKMGSPPSGCEGNPGNWFNVSWSGDPARQYGMYYLPIDVSFPVLELNQTGYATVLSKPECLGHPNEMEVPIWTYLTSDFETVEATLLYAPDIGTSNGQFLFPDDGYVVVVDVETGLSSPPIDLSVQLAPPAGNSDLPGIASLGGSDVVSSLPSSWVVGNYPNPANPNTTFHLELMDAAQVEMKVWNILGKEVATIINDLTMSAGSHRIDFDGTNLTTGIYIYRVRFTTPDGVHVIPGKFLLLK
ncbi:T9SS type A sorting domain-containing protein [bacterium]|nr:T9SS type A sorting domain-containing protein [bacterium]